MNKVRRKQIAQAKELLIKATEILEDVWGSEVEALNKRTCKSGKYKELHDKAMESASELKGIIEATEESIVKIDSNFDWSLL